MNFTVAKRLLIVSSAKEVHLLILSCIFTQNEKKKKELQPYPSQVIINEAMMNEIKHSVRRSNYAFWCQIIITQPDVKNIWSSCASSHTPGCYSASFSPPLPGLCLLTWLDCLAGASLCFCVCRYMRPRGGLALHLIAGRPAALFSCSVHRGQCDSSASSPGSWYGGVGGVGNRFWCNAVFALLLRRALAANWDVCRMRGDCSY